MRRAAAALIVAAVLPATTYTHALARPTATAPGDAAPPPPPPPPPAPEAPPPRQPATTMTTTTLPPETTTTTAPEPVPTTAPAPPPPPPPPDMLRAGDTGPEVVALQERLQELGYWIGERVGTYGSGTAHAVTAFQKASGIGRDGVVGPATKAALEGAGRVRPESTSGHVIEVDLRRQIMIISDDGHATMVLDVSTGAEPGSTPAGRYRIFRQVNGSDPGPYGPLDRPKYFVGGVAIHGYSSVPASPASHGCVRVTSTAIDMLWDSGLAPVGATVWVY